LPINSPSALRDDAIVFRPARCAKPDIGDSPMPPLSYLAYIATNCRAGSGQFLPEVMQTHTVWLVLSDGGKWAMFASCLSEIFFVCAAWVRSGLFFVKSGRT